MKLFLVWEFSEIESEPTASFVNQQQVLSLLFLILFQKKKKNPFPIHKTPTFTRFGRRDVRQPFRCLSFFFTCALFLIIICIFVKLNKEQCLKNWSGQNSSSSKSVFCKLKAKKKEE